MYIMGADFSGAKAPNLSVAIGRLVGQTLTIETILPCDDRLDLFHTLAYYSSAEQMCGLDFPFALPQAALQRLDVSSLHELAFNCSRAEFKQSIEHALGRFEPKCQSPSLFCRQTDVESHAYSGIKQVNPSLLWMLYSGAKLLWYLWDNGVMPYPFFVPSRNQVCEVYPSHTWQKVGLPRSTHLAEFVQRFNALGLIEVVLPAQYATVTTQDIADSVVACVTTGAVVWRDHIFKDWTTKPSFASDAEWRVAREEGLIVRI